MVISHDLSGTWTWSVDGDGPTPLLPEARELLDRRFDATVPGALHPDLLAANVIPDPFVDRNELAVEWVGRTDWRLSRTLDQVPTAERVDLVFDGLDTVASIDVNGREIGRSRNMHRLYRYDVTEALVNAENTIGVNFTSAYTEAEHWEQALGARPSAYPQPFAFIRKMASSFGWDWGPTLVSCGIWRGVRLEAWNVARIAGLRPLVDVVDGTGILTAHVDLELASSGQKAALAVDVSIAGQTVRREIEPGSTSTVVVVVVPEVERWFPRGFGDPVLYSAVITLSQGDDVLDARTTRVGFRTISVDREPDAAGTPFVIAVNDQPLFIKGVNWIPDSIFPGTVTAAQCRERLQQAVGANVNLVRVWGGGLYESDDFYDACDELGLLVWQDFLFACAAYPEEEPFREEVLAEARDNIIRLSSHPSLAIWNGNNENLWMRLDKAWAEQEGGDLAWGESFYLSWIPDLLRDLDPSRPYTEGSPWSGGWEHEPNHVDHQTFHSWDVWNSDDFADYRNSAPRFVSEFGWQGAATWRTLRDAVTDEHLNLGSANVRHHQKAIDGHAKIARNLARHFPEAQGFDQWHLQTQWLQMQAVTAGVLHWRANWPRTAGTILWQLNDLWAVTSWSAIDGAGRLKPLYHALREMYADRVITLEPAHHGLDLCVINDTDEPWVGDAHLQRYTNDGVIVASQQSAFAAEPRSVTRVALSSAVATFDDSAAEFVVARVDGERAFWHPEPPVRSTPVPGSVDVTATAVQGGLDVVVVAETVVRDLLVQADRIHPDATVDRGFVSLLPGESVVYHVRAPVPLDATLVQLPWVVTSLRDAV